jgi:hypothetical protein
VVEDSDFLGCDDGSLKSGPDVSKECVSLILKCQVGQDLLDCFTPEDEDTPFFQNVGIHPKT